MKIGTHLQAEEPPLSVLPLFIPFFSSSLAPLARHQPRVCRGQGKGVEKCCLYDV